YFFFQAEDGIRDFHVTGVQTCALPVPIWQLANENKSYQLTNLLENTSATLENHQLRIDVSNNATWLIMQSLPYLLDYPHQCSEQLFARYFANVIASNILENNPSIQQLVNEWKEN